MHPVDEVDVGVAWRAVHRSVALGAPAAGVRGLVLFPNIALDLDDAPGKTLTTQHPHQPPPKQVTSHGERVASEETPV